MKILAIEKEKSTTDWSKHEVLLEEEARAVNELQQAGFIREIYFNQDKNAVIILECDNILKAEEMLENLPLVKSGLTEFDIMELNPYT